MTITACNHTPCPEGYIAWHEWAEKMAESHHQIKCAGCGLFAVWVKREWPTYVDCSNCGATLDTEGWGREVFCPYCHKQIAESCITENAND